MRVELELKVPPKVPLPIEKLLDTVVLAVRLTGWVVLVIVRL